MPSYPKLKLIYFNAAGRAESIRLAFHLGDVPFEDYRFSHADFAALKPTFPFGQVPVLEVDGEALAQSQGLLRYAGRLANLYPANDLLSALKIDEIVSAFDEMQDKMGPSFHEQDPVKKKALREELATKTIPRYLSLVEARLVKMKQSSVFQTSDIFIHEIVIFTLLRILRNGVLDHIPTDIAEAYPEIVAAAAKVGDHKKVKEWFARPRNVAHKLKLTYFPGAGRAAPIRLAFHFGGIAFEDERIERAELEVRRASLPYGQLPVLEVDGEQVAQSLAILRYAGSLSGLYPVNDPKQAARIDELFGLVDEIYNALFPTYRMEPEVQLATRKALVDGPLAKFLRGADSRIASWGGQYAIGAELTVADLALHGVVMSFKSGMMANGIPVTFIDEFPNVIRVFHGVNDHPKVKEYLQTKAF